VVVAVEDGVVASAVAAVEGVAVVDLVESSKGAVVAVVADVDPPEVALPLPQLRVVPKVEERRLASSMSLRHSRPVTSMTLKNLRLATLKTSRMSTPAILRMSRLLRPASSLRNSSVAGVEEEVTPVVTAGEQLAT
jgi:hypothetical protein